MAMFLHALRAILVGCGVAWFGATAGLAAGGHDPAIDSAGRAAQPFGLSLSVLPEGTAVGEKWQTLARQLADERVQLALCDGDRENCASPAALRLLAIVDAARLREGRARLGEINRAINLAIRPMSDLAQYGEIDVWSSPLATFHHGAGDCEDYAIAKLMALWLAGIAADDLRVVIMRDSIHGDDHAVAAARLDGHWLMLDNMHMAMVEDVHVRNYRPLFAFDDTAIMRFSDTPLVASTRAPAPAATAAAAPAVQPGLIAAAE
jgi:predicted transglutaminase-like cysteine proteinase